MFDDEKIKLIEQMPDADTILIIWMKLLTQAGKTNSSGYIFLNENIPYTDEMLATIFNRPLSTIRLALKTFEDLGMVGIDEDSFISITNWSNHQSLERLNQIREQTRKRVQKHRDKKKLDSNDDVTLRNATEVERELEGELEKSSNNVERLDNTYKPIVDYLNQRTGRNYKPSTKKTKNLIDARINEGFNLNDFYIVIDKKVEEWLDDKKFTNYLRPETLFGTKFESYLNQEVISGDSEVDNLRELIRNDERGNAKSIGSDKNELPEL